MNVALEGGKEYRKATENLNLRGKNSQSPNIRSHPSLFPHISNQIYSSKERKKKFPYGLVSKVYCLWTTDTKKPSHMGAFFRFSCVLRKFLSLKEFGDIVYSHDLINYLY